MMKKNNKKSLVTLLIFGATVFLGSYFVNMKLLADQDTHEPQVAHKSDKTASQQLPWWQKWKRMHLKPFRGCQFGSTAAGKQSAAVDSEAVSDGAKSGSLATKQRGCFL